jgi:acetyl esterase/lipase
VLKKRRRLARGIGLTVLAGAAILFRLFLWDVTSLRLASPTRQIVESRDIVYRSGSTNPKHRLDVFAPEGARMAPVVHFVHGGYWVGGDKDYHAWATSLYASVGRALAAHGVVAVVQSYRLVPEVPFADLVDDVMAGLKWTEENAAAYGGDPSRLFTMGHSAGGHLVALAAADDTVHTSRGMDPAAVRGTIAISAVWDIEDMHATQDEAFQERVTYPVFGHDPATWAGASPLAKLHAPARRFLVMHGEKDYPYLIPQADKARARLTSLGAEPAWYVAPGNDHDAMVLRFGTRDDNMIGPILEFVGAR